MTTRMSAWRLRSSMKWAGKSATSVLEMHVRGAAAALVVGRRFVLRHERMILQELRHGAAQLTGAVPVHDAELTQIGHGDLVQELFEPGQRLVHGAADDIQLGEHAF